MLLYFHSCLVLGTSSSSQDCIVSFEDINVCVCSGNNTDGPVKCHNDSNWIEVQPCYCVHYDPRLNKTVVGHCYYTCYQHHRTAVKVFNSTTFNDNFCNSSCQTGYFCYNCNSNCSLAVHSYKLFDCVQCLHYSYNWLKYFAVTLLPLTLLYFLTILLSCKITSSKLCGLVLVLQCIIASPLRTYFFEQSDKGLNAFLKLAIGMLEIVNLNFFRTYSSLHFCLYPKLNVFEILTLDCLTALYPFCLIFITYALITAYDNQCKLLVWMWQPFKKCTKFYRDTYDIRTSLVEIFASFILLSSIKIMQASFVSWLGQHFTIFTVKESTQFLCSDLT